MMLAWHHSFEQQANKLHDQRWIGTQVEASQRILQAVTITEQGSSICMHRNSQSKHLGCAQLVCKRSTRARRRGVTQVA